MEFIKFFQNPIFWSKEAERLQNIRQNRANDPPNYWPGDEMGIIGKQSRSHNYCQADIKIDQADNLIKV